MFVSLQFKLVLKKEDREKLVQLMRKQSSAIRAAYRMLLITLVQSLQGEPSGCEGANGRNPELASSEGSPPLPHSWKGLAEGPFSSEASVGGRGVG